MAHCKRGNTLTQTNIATGTVTYFTWDYQNRLTEVKVVSSTGTVLNDEKFTYDVFGNRIGVSLNGTQTLYTVYDGSNPYIDFNGSGTLTERYLTNPDALSQFYGQVSAGGTVQWILTDNIDSIREVVDSSGNSLDAIAYDPWGTILSQSNAANAPRMMYAGGAYDPITGMYTDGARELNPADGRWMSQDPFGFATGAFNLYGYVYNNPLKMIDPTGLEEQLTGSGWRQRPLKPMYQIFSDGTVASSEDGRIFYVYHPSGFRGYFYAGQSRYTPIMAKDYYPAHTWPMLPSGALPGNWIEYPNRGFRFSKSERDYIIERLPSVNFPPTPITCRFLNISPYFWAHGYSKSYQREMEYKLRLYEMQSEAARNSMQLFPHHTLTLDYYALFSIPGWEGASAGIANVENSRGDDGNSWYQFSLNFSTLPEGGNKR